VAEHKLHRRIDEDAELQGWRRGRTQRVASGFYTSQALELTRMAAPTRTQQGPVLAQAGSPNSTDGVRS